MKGSKDKRAGQQIFKVGGVGKAEQADKCPLILSAFDGCYCTSLHSKDIEAAVYYCGGNFESCEIFKRRGGTAPFSERVR